MVVVQSCNHHIRLLRHIRPLIDRDPLRTIITPCCEHYLWHALLRTHALTIVMRCCQRMSSDYSTSRTHSFLSYEMSIKQSIKQSQSQPVNVTVYIICRPSPYLYCMVAICHWLTSDFSLASALTKRMTCKIATLISGGARRGLGG